MLQRGLAVLDCFDANSPELGLSALARRTQLPVSTTARLVTQLVRWGALARTDARTYVIGQRVWDLGLLSPVNRELRAAALPYLRDVYTTTRSNVHLAVRDDTSALFVERLSDAPNATLISSPGSRLPLYACGVGKAMLAYCEGTVVEQSLQESTSFTSQTVVTLESLQPQLLDVRAHGYAHTEGEYSHGASSLGVPILSPGGTALGAIGIVAKAKKSELIQLVPVLQVAARGIARSLDIRADQAYVSWGAGPTER